MINVNFILKEPKSKNETLIYLIINVKGKRLKYSTGEKIEPKAWDKITQRPSKKTDYPYKEEINSKLQQYETLMNDQLIQFRYKKEEVTIKKLKELLNKKFRKDSSKIYQKESLIPFIERYIAECEQKKRRHSKGYYSEDTTKGYRTTLNHIKNYCDDRKTTTDFNDITLKFYDDFLCYCDEIGHAVNTNGKNIKNLKVFMNIAFGENLHSNLDFKKTEFRATSETSDSIYLNTDELKQITNLDLSEHKHLEKSRDLFIFGANTALRFSDLTTLKEHHFIEHENIPCIKKRTVKNEADVLVPLTKDAIRIREKYNYNLPNEITNQYFNRNLKEIGKLAKIDTIVVKEIKRGKVKTETEYKKYELITTHTARRSAATNMFKSGIPSINIMKITGHRTESIFMKYIKIGLEENAMELSKLDFFNN